ncbi:DUF4391 domain-containing protein [Clostridium tyrobutyricum]|jgi:hypothetical protein|uniref:DUF4391 domain-containing protein n=1 Tax=Clostridium tyrobutyricum TaxID=1519 RepID=UPI00073D2831|nr:DUF4391 domain-containing protein [Clostridium tyrobutyricum]QCH27760.1 hypothetical protein EZN00_01358 [Clostridium tyrobutyricum]
MISKLYKKMNIPATCEVGNTIFKKLFYENSNMSTSDKNIFTNDIEKIVWKYSFKEENLHIKPYETENLDYEEIAVIEVLLSYDKKYRRIAEIIQKTIPYPLILVFVRDDNILLNVASKRVNKVDVNKNTVEDYIYSSWINLSGLKENEEKFLESIDIRNFSFVNMYKFYHSFVEKIEIFNASVITGDFDNLKSKDIEQVNALNNEVESLNNDIERLKLELKREGQFNRRVDINIKIKKIEAKRNELIEKLKA